MATQYQNGGWYNGQQYWNGQLGAPGVINNPNQQGYQQPVSQEVNRQSSIAQGLAPNAIQNYLAQQTAQQQQQAASGGGAYGGGASGGLSGGVFDMANSILSFQQKANQPVVDALKSEATGIDKRYEDLLAKIKGDQTQAVNQQTIATNTELGNRGIGPDSGLYQQTLTSALQPVNQQYQEQYNSGVDAQTQARNDLAVRIAQASTGDPTGALNTAIGLSQGKQSNPYIDVGNSSSVFNTQTGQFIQNPNGGGAQQGGYLYTGQDATNASRYQLLPDTNGASSMNTSTPTTGRLIA
jgi:hypothetical protein